MKKSLLFLTAWLFGMVLAQQPARIIIDTEGSVHPWNKLEVNNAAETFQFAIVTDRTGGHRPGIFPKAIDKLNLLQPEFVMSVGDLIEGYTEDEARIDREWEEFTGFISKLQVPFFYVPGNHDYINDVMAKKWKERFGKDYYHFKYKDVLFLCLNSEERKRGAGRGYIDKPQYEYVKKTLAENTEVKWTLVFMHQPLWDQDDSGMWKDVEELLKDRKHTVYVGHRHRYVKYDRNNSKYFILATTGGGSSLRGPAFGEFDHVVWITMTEEGPIMANLLLDGIWDENVQTEEALSMTRKLTEADILEIKPLISKGTFTEGNFVVKMTNPADIPLKAVIELEAHPEVFIGSAEKEVEIEPNSVKEVSIPLKAMKPLSVRTMKPLQVEIEFSYSQENRPELVWEKDLLLKPLALMPLSRGKKKVKIDGKLKEWSGLMPAKTPFVQGSPFAHTGEKDGDFSFAISYDDDFLYAAIEVQDDELIFTENGDLFTQDAAFVQLDARPLNKMMDGNVGYYFRDWTVIGVAPKADGSAKVYEPKRIPQGVQFASEVNANGYTIEMAIPMDYIKAMQGENWKNLRINLGVHDLDKEGDHDAILFWMPDWRGEENVLGSGLFEKE